MTRARTPSALGVPHPHLPLKVNNETDARCTRKAVRVLRATVRAGRIAEAVLADLERDGYSRRRVHVLWPSRMGRKGALRLGGFRLTLEPAPPPDISVQRLRTVKVRADEASDRRGAVRANKFAVHCDVPCMERGSWTRKSFVLGLINLNSSPEKASLTFSADPLKNSYYNGSVYRSAHSGRAMTHKLAERLEGEAMRVLCDCLASVISGCPHDWDTPAEMIALRRVIPGMLESSGVAARIWAEIGREAEAIRTATQVLWS